MGKYRDEWKNLLVEGAIKGDACFPTYFVREFLEDVPDFDPAGPTESVVKNSRFREFYLPWARARMVPEFIPEAWHKVVWPLAQEPQVIFRHLANGKSYFWAKDDQGRVQWLYDEEGYYLTAIAPGDTVNYPGTYRCSVKITVASIEEKQAE